jgi:hypothetical protein
VEYHGINFDHTVYLESGVECKTCHIQVVQGTGGVPQQVCYSCHPEQLQYYEESETVHNIHVTQEKLECKSCHSPIEHGKFKISSIFNPECSSCHGSQHYMQEEFYMGMAAVGVTPKPDPMFLAKVDCKGCHQVKVQREITGHISTFSLAQPKSCTSCHGEGYDKLMNTWEKSINNLYSKINRQFSLASLSPETLQSEFNQELSLIRHNLEVIEVDGSRGVHNISYARSILNYSAQTLSTIMDKTGLYFGEKVDSREISNTCTVKCHVGIESVSIQINEKVFPHSPHIQKLSGCKSCHSPDIPGSGQHGLTYVDESGCNSCHHQNASASCGACHKTQKLFYSGDLLTDTYNMPDVMYEAGITCEACHEDPEKPVRPDKNVCLSCHEDGYDEMFIEWQNEVKTSFPLAKNQLEQVLRNWMENNKSMNQNDYRSILNSLYLLDKIEEDGSNGIHNYMTISTIISDLNDQLNLSKGGK